MDTRTLTLTLSLASTACAGSVFPPALPEGPSSAPMAVTPEARAERALDRIAHACEDESGCATYVQDDIYPNVQVSSVERYFVTSLPQEVRSVGFQLRFDPGGDRLEIERGNTLAYRFDEDP